MTIEKLLKVCEILIKYGSFYELLHGYGVTIFKDLKIEDISADDIEKLYALDVGTISKTVLELCNIFDVDVALGFYTEESL